jgi:hypothetical protein
LFLTLFFFSFFHYPPPQFVLVVRSSGTRTVTLLTLSRLFQWCDAVRAGLLDLDAVLLCCARVPRGNPDPKRLLDAFRALDGARGGTVRAFLDLFLDRTGESVVG